MSTSEGGALANNGLESGKRRMSLLALAAAALAPLSAYGTVSANGLHPVCPDAPGVSCPECPLTIDAHCHVFNGSDLQIKEFLSRVVARQFGLPGFVVTALAELLQHLAWQHAPSGKEELAKLDALAGLSKTCSAEDYASRVDDLRKNGYDRARTQLQAALRRSPQLQKLARRLEKRKRGTPPKAHNDIEAAQIEAISIIKSLPRDYQRYEAERLEKAQKQETYSRLPWSRATYSVHGFIHFIRQNFQYRYVSVHDYLKTYDRPGTRVVDLMLPMMVDYDFWLNKGDPTHTGLEDQVKVLRQISILTNGRVHAFVPFNPLRQVAFELGLTKSDSLSLVQKAIREDGFVGVKLYPPMGFAILGNAEHDGKGFWKQKWLPDWMDRSDLGSRLDGAMRKLLAWCESEQVPLMGHSGQSNGPSDEFQALTDARYWGQALSEFPDLRVSFGHFGDSSPDAQHMDRARAFAALMHAGAHVPGAQAYADAGYFVEVLSKEPSLKAVLEELYRETSSKGEAALVNRFMYGTDWEMTLVEKGINGYLTGFETLFKELAAQPAIKSQGHAGLADRFFGLNAAKWAGLYPGDPARNRLDNFYRQHGLNPDWTAKLATR